MDLTKTVQTKPECRHSKCVIESRFFNLSLDLFCIVGFDGYFKILNLAWETTLGYTREELLEKPYIELVHPEDRESAIAAAQNLKLGRCSGKFQHRCRCKDGTYKWLSWTATCFSEESSIYGVVRDITDSFHHQAVAELTEKVQHSALRSKIGVALTQSSDLSQMLQRCCAALVEHFDAAFARIWTLNSKENILELQASAGIYTHINGAHARIPVGSFKIGLIAQERLPHLTNDVPNDTRIGDREWAQREGMVAFAGYPLIVEDRIVGVMAMFSRHPLSYSVLEALASIAIELAVGIERKRAEESLEISQERLLLALEGSALGIWDWNLSTGKIYFDLHWKQMLGYEIDEIENTFSSLERLVHADDLPKVKETLNSYLKGKIPVYEVEFRMQTKSGSWKWILSRGKVFAKDKFRNPVRMIGTHKDISARLALKQELALEQARLKAFFAAAPIGINILDEQLRFVQINELLAEIGGLSVEDHIGKTIWETWPEFAPKLEPIYKEVLQAGTPLLNIEICTEVPCRSGVRRDWLVSFFPIIEEDGSCSGAGTVMLEITDRKRTEEALQQQLLRERLMGTILERIRASLNLEEILNTAVEEVRHFLQTDRTVIYRFYPDWSGVVEVESVGAGWVATKGTDIQDNCFVETHVPLYQKGRIRAIANIHTAGLNECHVNVLAQLQVQANLVVPILQGENLWGLLIAHHCRSPREWLNCEIECLKEMGVQLAIAIQQSTLFQQAQTEIAERKAAEIALQQSEARERQHRRELEIALRELKNTQSQLVQHEKMASLGQLVAGVAHEINNPVNFIYGNIKFASEYASDLLELVNLYQKSYPIPATEISDRIQLLDLDFLKKDFPRLLNSMKEGANRIKEIVLSLRNFSRLDEAETKEADVHSGIDSTLMILQHRLKEQPSRRTIQVIKDFADLPQLDCYPGQLNQVFMNILSNAIDALEEKIKEDHSFIPQLRITTQLVNEKVKIRIADNGKGIPPAVKEHLFEPFFTTKPVGKGTGLGLAISYQIIVEKHKGKLECHTEVGKGTEFVITINLKKD